ncbi:MULTISPECIES: glycosyltransferase family 4 protein [unclassified Paenibacillus]|uniref:glycosyltransferase family 4 protein n=1 Tax=unclassified Paenibacillus TaxID=185978 RepID=UPI001C1196F9|nr:MULTISPECIES: glycosyltransferase family 4 protein [unclassified Paenibacillus]MBU5440823.1 glycosyltransferase family 4 protein [Paenibacillus sp. MSJ-34]CAH0118480.1 D-inositol-3-phosphate glycosyltransferase [Paenibacillus sp. CECT 9249]
MKILLATYFISPHVGGVWEFMTQMKRRLEGFGHVVDLFSSGPGHQTYHISNANRVLHKEQIMPLLSAKINAALYPELAEDGWIRHFEFECLSMEIAAAYFGLNEYDIIHTQDVFATRAFSRVKPIATPLIASLHGSAAEEYRLHFIENDENLSLSRRWKYHQVLEYLGASSGDVTVTSSHWLKNKLVKEFAVPSDKVRVFQYGYDINRFMERMSVPSGIDRIPGKKTIIFTGRLVEIKGVHFLLSALAELKSIRQDWHCRIVGSGPEQEKLHHQSLVLGLQHYVSFMGNRTDVPYMLAISDIFVCPSILDNQPLSLIEAQIAGLPAVVNDAAGIPEMVEQGITGFVCPTGKTTAMVYYLNVLLEDESLRRHMGAQAQRWAIDHWSYDRMLQRFLDLYEELRGGKK